MAAAQEDRCYRNQAKRTLENEFRRISCAAINQAFASSGYNFTRAYHSLSEIERQRDDVLRDSGVGRFALFRKHVKVFIKQDRATRGVPLTSAELIGETDVIPALVLHQKKELPVVNLSPDDERENESVGAAAAAKEAEMECLCCYGEYPRSEMRECKAGSGHLVCKTCLYHYVSEQLDGNGSTVFKCICDAECPHEYSTALLDQALTPKLNKRANERRFQEEVEKAGIPSWTCSKCAHVGFVEQKYPWIHCPQCNVKYCTDCHEIFHENKTCDEVRREKTRLGDPKHRAHEAMSRACMRTCPHCKQEYTKSDGCNKIKCKCKRLSCYLCGEKILGYSHFCRCAKNKCTCGKKCPLFTNTQQEEKMNFDRRRAAGRVVLVEAGFTDEREILSVLATPPKKKMSGKRKTAPLAAAVVPVVVVPLGDVQGRVATPRRPRPAAAAAAGNDLHRPRAVFPNFDVGRAHGNMPAAAAVNAARDPPAVARPPLAAVAMAMLTSSALAAVVIVLALRFPFCAPTFVEYNTKNG